MERRKDMWKLLYSLVNRSEVELDDVCAFIDEILCKESSLIKQSLNENINHFQDTFILWLVHKLLTSLNINIQKSTQENCLKIQCKLLNSCLVNRPPLFEKLFLAYVNAMEQLIDAYAKENILSNKEINLNIAAFTTEDCCLKDIDNHFQFAQLQVPIKRIDDFMQIFLHILHHAISTGYQNYPDIFIDSLTIIFKILKECDMTTKLLCLQYMTSIFQNVSTLNGKLEAIYELCLRMLAIMWGQMSLWLEHNCFPTDDYNMVIEKTCLLLNVLQTFQTQLTYEKLMLKHSVVLIQHLLGIYNSPMKNYNIESTLLVMDSTINYIYSLIRNSTKIQSELTMDKCLLICRIAEVRPNIIRLMTLIIEVKFPAKEATVLSQYICKRIECYAHKNHCSLQDIKMIVESLASIVKLEHFLLYKQQSEYFNNRNCKEDDLPVTIPIKQLHSIMGITTQELYNSLTIIITKVKQMCINIISDDTIKLAGLMLKSSLTYNALNHNNVNELLEIILKPIKQFSKYIKDFIVLNASLEVLSILDFKITTEIINNINMSMIALAEYMCSQTSLYDLRKKFIHCLQHLLVIGWCKADLIYQKLKNIVLINCDMFCALLKITTCTNENGMFLMTQHFGALTNICDLEPFEWFHMKIICSKCQSESADTLSDYIIKHTAVIKPSKLCCYETNRNIIPLDLDVKNYLLRELLYKSEYIFIANHLNDVGITLDDCLKVITTNINIRTIYLPTFNLLLRICLRQNCVDFFQQIVSILYQETIQCFQLCENEDIQHKLLQFFTCCAETQLLNENFLFQLFKLTFFFLTHPESKVINEAIICALEMCIQYKILPIQLWNWYKREAMTLIIRLAIYVYLAKGVRLTRSLRAFTNMLGFSCVQEFICKYYRLIVTLIVPYCIKEPRCKGLLINISKITSKKVDHLLALSFLRTYSHIYFMEEPNVRNASIDLVTKCTGSTVSTLMNNDIKQTVSEILVYYNRNPEFVMQAFQCLLPRHPKTVDNTKLFSNFIADRFLGVITYFQTCLAETNYEKSLKEETLLSLGEIMRIIGTDNVTQFRFKIIAMLSFVLTLNDINLKNICLKIWNVFLHIVNIEKLGPLLSGIVATLQALLDTNADDVNNIYEFLILKNDVLLGAFIPDLYFMENMQNVNPSIKQYVKHQYDIYTCERNNFLDKLGFLYKQIINDNIAVRMYGFKYLRELINKHRDEVNHLILDVIGERDTLLEQVINTLVSNCCHMDRNVQLAAAKCLGELGAVDPSYLFSNYSFEKCPELCLSIHTDDFAIWALTELCRAYQYQKDTKYVDNFSLAIQETLSAFGISPGENKKLNIWQAVPQHMRQIMEPLLNSCYTNSKREYKNTEHPLFLSNALTNHEDWSFAWACRLIELIQDVDTSHLLNSYKPSFKRDNKTLVLFFPYILLHALQDSNETEAQRIYEEFYTVFNHGHQSVETSSIQSLAESDDNYLIYKEFPMIRYFDDSNINTNSMKRELPCKIGEEQGGGLTSKKWETCTKFCSEQIDFLQRWLREWLRLNLVGGKMPDSNQTFMAIKNFLGKFNKLEISKANYNAGDYMRALLYLEDYIENNRSEFQEQLSFLLEIHGKLLDADSVEGAVYLKKTNLTLAEEILVNRLLDRPQETIICYEQLLSNNEVNITQDDIKNMIDSYLCMDISATALLTVDGLWKKLSDQYTDDYFKECKSEILWRLGRFDELEELLEDSFVKDKTDNWNIQCAEAFLLFRKSSTPIIQLDSGEFSQQLDNIRSNVLMNMYFCVGVAEISYNLCYDEIIRLHLLEEMEKQNLLINKIIQYTKQCDQNQNADCELLKQTCLHEIQEVFNNWYVRLNVLPPMSNIMETVFCFRRNLLQESQRMLKFYEDLNKNIFDCVKECINEEIGRLWLRSVQMYRDNGCLQQAHLSLLKAEPYNPITLFLEKAQLMWQKGNQTKAFKLLEENIERLELACSTNIRTLSVSERHIYGEAKFLQATYNAEAMNICPELNLKYFEQALSGNRASEKCLVHLAQYQEKVFDSYASEQKDSESGARLQLEIMLNYAKSLKYGHTYVYQSLPRLLSIWLDFSSQLMAASGNQAAEATPMSSSSSFGKLTGLTEVARKMNDLISNCNNMLPSAIFYTAFSQLLSRICHPSNDVYNNIRNIVVKLIQEFPQQSLWMLLPVFKSCHAFRIKRCRSIFTDARLNNSDFQKLFTDFNMLAERLIELTNKEVVYDETYQLSCLVRQLPRLFKDQNFSEIMLPFEKYMQATFPISSTTGYPPRSDILNKSGTPQPTLFSPNNAFPHKAIYIRGIDEEVVVLRSAAKPKKISIQCSDGQTYNVMVKPKDDLRKDFRLMEFNGLVKRYLHQDSQARYRRLRIRTYAAIPFNEECGLVEWLPRLNSFRGICMSIYRRRGLGIADRLLKQCALPRTDSLEKKRSVFNDVLLPRHPPVFYEWFRQQFPTPNSWYQARMAYVKTIAVMSMVGYILGLGDRHGENILFDETNGDAVHVDFNCLFNQGECFAYPEIVPFRLTHNMVFAMGPLGVEGLFRKCCEITLRVLKDEKRTLMSVLRPFVYDLSSLQRSKVKTSTLPSLELTDPKAMLDVKRIEERLKGYVKKTLGNSMPLSIEGQVNFLIKEATDIDNLAAMYIGWGAFI